MTTYIDREEINVSEISVATTNGDPFAMEAEHEAYISGMLESADSIECMTSEDDDFCDWASRLDFHGTEMPRAIYVVNGNELAFVLTKDNPYYD